MKTFIRDMIIGWVLYTDSGKKVANKIVTIVVKQVATSVSNSSQFKELVSLKDIFTKGEEKNDDK